jgi:uncharacterized phiE125 gp8 family phage protein
MSHRTPKIIEDVVDEPITVAEARAHCEAPAYEDSDQDPLDDAMFETWITAAREHCEDFLGLSLATKTLEIALDAWPTVRTDGSLAIDLPGGPVREIVQVMVPAPDAEYSSDDVDSDSLADEPVYADGMVNPDQYVLDSYRQPAQLRPVTTWPAFTAAPNALTIRYLAGYGVDSGGGEALPAKFKAAMLLVIAHLFEHRSENTETALQSLPLGVHALLRPRRVRLGMA